MHATINPKSIADMANTLENHEIGAAIRLLNRILATGRPVAEDRVRTICQMDEDGWARSQNAILELFEIEDGHVTHAELRNAARPTVAAPSRARVGVTTEMPLIQPTREHNVPSYTTREKPELLSIKRTAYLVMEELFERSNQSKKTARAVLASLLKNWPEGDVYQAVQNAGKQDFVVDPRSWLIASLQRNSKPLVNNRARREELPPPQKAAPRAIVTPTAAGVSSATAERIKQRNAQLTMIIPAKSTQQ